MFYIILICIYFKTFYCCPWAVHTWMWYFSAH